MSNESPPNANNFDWNTNIDEMLAQWCDECKCFEWMHSESYTRYSRWSIGMSVTTNTIIALCNIANLVIGTMITSFVPPSIILGCISIFISIINMMQDKFNWMSMANTFNSSSIHYNSISRKIEEQLSVPWVGRHDCRTFLKYIKQDLSSVVFTNTSIPDDIRERCLEKFGAIPNFTIPEICGRAEHTRVYSQKYTELVNKN